MQLQLAESISRHTNSVVCLDAKAILGYAFLREQKCKSFGNVPGNEKADLLQDATTIDMPNPVSSIITNFVIVDQDKIPNANGILCKTGIKLSADLMVGTAEYIKGFCAMAMDGRSMDIAMFDSPLSSVIVTIGHKT